MTGTTWLQESGFLEGPIAITNTHSVGVVRDAILQWQVVAAGPAALGPAGRGRDLGRPAERHQRLPREARARDRGARRRPRRAGRRGQRGRRHRDDLPRLQGRHRHGLARARRRRTAATRSACWSRPTTAGGASSRIAGVPGRRGDPRPDALPRRSPASSPASASRPAQPPRPRHLRREGQGSIIVVVATDAPLLPHQLKRVATRAVARHRPHGRPRQQQLGRHLRGVLDREPGRRRQQGQHARRDAAQRQHQRALRRHGPGDRGGDPERAARRRDDDGPGRRARDGTPARPVARRLRKYGRLR